VFIQYNMKEFTLNTITTYLQDEEVMLTAYPSDSEISDFIKSNVVTSSSLCDATFISNFVQEQTPLMFANFQSMENISVTIKEQYYI